MHAIILAAGMGTRLGAGPPKPLAEIARGRTLISNQIEILTGIISPDHITIVVGHEAAQVVRSTAGHRHVVNDRFCTTNTAKSLLLALRDVDDDVLWINADLYVEPDAAEKLLAAAGRSAAALVDRSAAGREQMKYRLDEGGFIAEVSKHVPNPRGESLGMHAALRAEVPALQDALEQCDDHDYFEHALTACIRAGAMSIRPVDVGAAYCREVDSPDDLAAVRERLASANRARNS